MSSRGIQSPAFVTEVELNASALLESGGDADLMRKRGVGCAGNLVYG